MNTYKLFLLLLCVGYLSACVSGTQGYWANPTRSDDQKNKDVNECNYEVDKAFATTSSKDIASAIRNGRNQGLLFQSCMKSKGYQWEIVEQEKLR